MDTASHRAERLPVAFAKDPVIVFVVAFLSRVETGDGITPEDPVTFQSWADDPRTAMLRDALRRAKVTQIGEVLGAGTFGTAAAFGEDRVVKLTTDPAEVAVGTALVGKHEPTPHVIRIDGAWKVAGVTVEGVVGWDGENDEPIRAPVGVGVLVEERVDPIDEFDRRKINEIARDFQVSRDVQLFEILKLPIAKRRAHLRTLSEGLSEEFGSTSYSDIGEALTELRELGIYAIDVHGGNVGVDRETGSYKLFDIGVGSPPRGTRPKVIGKTRAKALALAEAVVGQLGGAEEGKLAGMNAAEPRASALEKVWIVRDPTPTSELIDIVWEQCVRSLDDYMRGADAGYWQPGQLRPWRAERHTLYKDKNEAIADALERLRKVSPEREGFYNKQAHDEFGYGALRRGGAAESGPGSVAFGREPLLDDVATAAVAKQRGGYVRFVAEEGKRARRFDVWHEGPSGLLFDGWYATFLESGERIGPFDTKKRAEQEAKNLVAAGTRESGGEGRYPQVARGIEWQPMGDWPQHDSEWAKLPDGGHYLIDSDGEGKEWHVRRYPAGGGAPRKLGTRDSVHAARSAAQADFMHHPNFAREAGENLTAAQRKALKAAMFALPHRRDLPMGKKNGVYDAGHVQAAAGRLGMMRNDGHVTKKEYLEAHGRLVKAGKRVGIQIGAPKWRAPSGAAESSGAADFAVIERDRKAVRDGQKLAALTTPKAVYAYCAEVLLRQSQECFVVLPMDIHGHVLNPKPYLVAMGQRDRVAVNVEDVLRPVTTTNAASFIVCHHHPAGSRQPSERDDELTKEIADKTPSTVAFLDHCIITEGHIWSSTDKRGYACK